MSQSQCERCLASIDAPAKEFGLGTAALMLLTLSGPGESNLCGDCAGLYNFYGVLALGAVVLVGAVVFIVLV